MNKKQWNDLYNYDFFLELAAGRIPGKSQEIKFGEIPSIALNTLQDVWDFTPALYTFQADVVEHFISSSNNSDTQTIYIKGLGEDKKLKEMTVTLAGQTKTSIGNWYRTFRIANVNDDETAGNIYIYEDDTVTAGVPDTDSKVRAYMAQTEQQTLMCIYTIPIDKKGYLIATESSFSNKQSADITHRLKVRSNGGPFRTAATVGIEQSYHPVVPYGVLDPLMDIKAQAYSDTAGVRVDGKFFIILEDI